MGHTPRVMLEWGRGFEDAKTSADNRNSVQESLTLALDVMESMGVHVRKRKVLTVSARIDPKCAGETFSPNNLVLYSQTTVPDTTRAKDYPIYYDALTIGHELFHGIRMEYFDDDGWLENACTEGNAYNGEDVMRDIEPVLRVVSSQVAAVKAIVPHAVEELEDGFLARASKKALEPGDDDWLSAEFTNFELNRAEVFGISTVSRILEQGIEFRESLVTQPIKLIELS